MAAPVYSVRFITVNAAEGEATYTVPPNMVAIVRDCDFFEATGAENVTVALGSDGTGSFFTHLSDGSWAARSWSWRGRFVIAHGGVIGIAMAGGAWNGHVSGYLLSAS